MRLPSSSSLLLASLAVSSSSSSLSALAAPVGDGPVPGPPPPSVPPQGSDDAMAQPNGTPASCTITFLSDTATAYLPVQASGLVDKLIVTLPLPPDLVNAIPGLIHGILDPLVGKDAPTAREAPQTTRAEEADHGRGEHAASEGSSMQPSSMRPFTSQPEASTPPAARRQDAPVIAPNPPAGCSSQPSSQSGPVTVRRQYGGTSAESQGKSPAPNPPPLPPLPGLAPPAPPAPSGSVAGGSADGTTG